MGRGLPTYNAANKALVPNDWSADRQPGSRRSARCRSTLACAVRDLHALHQLAAGRRLFPLNRGFRACGVSPPVELSPSLVNDAWRSTEH